MNYSTQNHVKLPLRTSLERGVTVGYLGIYKPSVNISGQLVSNPILKCMHCANNRHLTVLITLCGTVIISAYIYISLQNE
jgi:hypothetical protein